VGGWVKIYIVQFVSSNTRARIYYIKRAFTYLGIYTQAAERGRLYIRGQRTRTPFNLVGLCRRLPPLSVLGHTPHHITSHQIEMALQVQGKTAIVTGAGSGMCPAQPYSTLPGQTSHVESTQYMDCDGDGDGDIDTYIAFPPN
jgi:hypothetical protein